MNFNKLTIVHNFGRCVLENGTIEGGVAKGTCTDGGDNERLLWATSYTPYPTGVEKEWNLYGQKPHEQSPGNFYIDVCFF